MSYLQPTKKGADMRRTPLVFTVLHCDHCGHARAHVDNECFHKLKKEGK